MNTGVPLSKNFNFNNFHSVAISPDGLKVYFVDGGNKTLRVASSGPNPQLQASMDASFAVSPELLTVSPDGKTLYMSDSYLQCVYVIDIQNLMPRVLRVINGVSHIDGIAISPDSSKVYIYGTVDAGDTFFYVVDPNTGKVLSSVQLNFDPHSLNTSLVVTKDGSTAYATGHVNDQSTIAVIDTKTVKVTKYIPLDIHAYPLVVSPDGATIYAGGAVGSGIVLTIAVAKIDIKTGAVTYITPRDAEGQPLPNGITSISINQDGSKLYFMRLFGGNLLVMPVNSESVTRVNIQALDQPGNFIG